MRRILPVAIGWTARIGGWALLLGLASFTVANHQGMGVRGQVARLNIRSERDDALDGLLRRAGLDGAENLVLRPTSLWSYWRPFATLVPAPCHVTVSPIGTPIPGVTELIIVFNTDGELAGAPVKWVQLSPRPEYAGHFVGSPVEETDPTFLVIGEYRRVPVTAGAATRFEVYYRVYRLNREESPSVLTVVFTYNPKGWMYLEAERDRHDRTAVELVTYATMRHSARTVVATFVWDSERERFIEPPPDPQGRWRVVD